MRCALFKTFAALIFLVAIRAGAQINPALINWPATCITPGSTYAPATNSCVTTSGTGLPINNPQYTGGMTGPTMLTSINTQINVMATPYNAKGDCVTDDHASIMAALAAAATYSIGGSTAAEVFFPKPPGGCYLTSTIEWNGAPLMGPSGGIYGGNQASPIEIKGKPGQDILHVKDPGLGAFVWLGSWTIQNIHFMLDDTVSTVGAFPHRFPGRWVDDAAMTSGTAVLRTSNGVIGCGDVGQPVQVNGAGAAGANLVTTILSVFPCWLLSSGTPVQTVTLAANAATSVSNARLYISVNNYPVTYTLGNAALAFDNSDGNPANWPVGAYGGSPYSTIHNVTINTVSNSFKGQNGSTGYWTQGVWGAYALQVDMMNIQRVEWGVVQGCNDINPFFQSCANDYQRWTHMAFTAKNPWVSYNGLRNRLEDIQLTTDYGFIFLQTRNTFGDLSDDLFFSNAGWETGATSNKNGFRYSGNNAQFKNLNLSSGNGQTAFIDGAQVTCDGCTWNGLQLGGFANHFTAGPTDYTAVTTNVGRGNTVTTDVVRSPPLSIPSNTVYTLIPTRTPRAAGRFSGDFLLEDQFSTPYNHDDLLIWPGDILINNGGNPWSCCVGYDTNSPSGEYMLMPNAMTNFYGYISQYAYAGSKPGLLTLGANFPASAGTFYLSAMCPSGSSFTEAVSQYNGSSNVDIATQAFSCNTTYQIYKMRYDATAVPAGRFMTFRTSVNTVRFAWAYFLPDRATINNKTLGAGVAITTGPATAAAGNVPTFVGTDGHVQDSGVALSSLSGGSPSVYNMVTQGGIDNTGATDVSSAIVTILMSFTGTTNAQPFYFPPGTYKINAGVNLACTASTCNGLIITGAGKPQTIFQSTCTNGYAWWWNSSAVTGSYWYGPQMRDLQIKDTSGSGACNSLLRTTQVANFIYSNLELDSAAGITYSTGTVSITNGTTGLVGVGTTWTAAMVPGILRIANKPQFICTFTDATHVSLCDNWQQTTASGAGYSLQYNGQALLLDGGVNFEQYGSVYNMTSIGSQICVATVPSTSGSIGNSRDKFYGGFCNPQRIPNAMGFAFGQYTDSMDTDMAINNVATCWFADGSHDNKIMGQCENDGAPTVSTTCNGGVASQSCLIGAEFTGASTSTSYGNVVDGILTANLGVAVQRDSTNVINLYITNLRAASFSNTNNYSLEGTTGCPASGSTKTVTIFTYDCVHSQVAATVNLVRRKAVAAAGRKQ